MKIAIFDYRVVAGNPAGGCHLALLRALASEHEFTVFSVQFENPKSSLIEWVRVPAPTRPLALLFVSFHVLAPIVYLWHRLRTGKRFDIVQSIESNLGFGDLVYSHFSHRTYLRSGPPSQRSLRGLLRWIDHRLHAFVEGLRYPAARLLIVPSPGLAEELQRDFGVAAERVQVISNPIAPQRMERPADFDRDTLRRQHNLSANDVIAVFFALGHFERKGLPLLLEALQDSRLGSIKLLVVGGEADLIARYRRSVAALGIAGRVCFAGKQADVRPFLWSADAFVLPSAYESFSLAAYEAAAASLPIVAPPLNGIRELLRDGENGFVIERTVDSIATALQRIAAMSPAERHIMGAKARLAVLNFTEQRFADAWRNLYRKWDERQASPKRRESQTAVICTAHCPSPMQHDISTAGGLRVPNHFPIGPRSGAHRRKSPVGIHHPCLL